MKKKRNAFVSSARCCFIRGMAAAAAAGTITTTSTTTTATTTNRENKGNDNEQQSSDRQKKTNHQRTNAKAISRNAKGTFSISLPRSRERDEVSGEATSSATHIAIMFGPFDRRPSKRPPVNSYHRSGDSSFRSALAGCSYPRVTLNALHITTTMSPNICTVCILPFNETRSLYIGA